MAPYGDDRIDEWMDETLRRYNAADDDPGVRIAATRTMLRISPPEIPQPAPRRFAARLWPWLWAAACAAAIVVVALLWMAAPPTPRPSHVPLRAAAAPAPSPAAPSPAQQERREISYFLTRQRMPKQRIFPTPSPLTPEEQALVVLIENAPPQVRLALIQAQEHPLNPSSLSAFKTDPLTEGITPGSTNLQELP